MKNSDFTACLINDSGFVITGKDDLDSYNNLQKNIIINLDKKHQNELDIYSTIYKNTLDEQKNTYAYELEVNQTSRAIEISSLNFQVEIVTKNGASNIANAEAFYEILAGQSSEWYID